MAAALDSPRRSAPAKLCLSLASSPARPRLPPARFEEVPIDVRPAALRTPCRRRIARHYLASPWARGRPCLALLELAKRLRVPLGVDLSIAKHIPSGAGSRRQPDSATVLARLNRLWSLDWRSSGCSRIGVGPAPTCVLLAAIPAGPRPNRRESSPDRPRAATFCRRPSRASLPRGDLRLAPGGGAGSRGCRVGNINCRFFCERRSGPLEATDATISRRCRDFPRRYAGTALVRTATARAVIQIGARLGPHFRRQRDTSRCRRCRRAGRADLSISRSASAFVWARRERLEVRGFPLRTRVGYLQLG